MITSFEVGAIFRIINEASPALAQILRQVRELNLAIDKARQSLATLGKSVMPAGLSTAVAETGSLAEAWGLVAKNAAAAQRAIGSASTAAVRAPVAASAVATGGGGGRHRPGWLGGGGGTHVYGPGASIPGGGHVRFGGGATAAAGLLGYGVYEAAEMEKYVWQMIYHSSLEQNDANRAKFRKIVQDSMAETGYGLTDTAKAALSEIRMFKGTPGGGVGVLPEMLSASGKEAIAKDNSLEESMKSLIGFAHMLKVYTPEGIAKLAPAFAFLSTANPDRLGQIERSASYAVPLLQSGLEIDPIQSLLLGTALRRAGAVSTKSGTWLREMALRAMPGTSLMSKIAYKKHEESLKELGLVDDKGKPTWFTDGKPDLLKMLDIGGANAAKVPLTRRAAIERQLFGAQGGGGFALLADPAVRDQVQNLQKEMRSPEFQNQYRAFFPDYLKGSTVQQARTAMAEFNITMMEIGKDVLPAVNVALKDFKSVLEGLRGILPGADKFKSAATVGARVLEGAGAGALYGALGGPGGVLGGAVIGGVAGGVLGTAEGYMGEHGNADKKSALAAGERPADRYARRIENLRTQNEQAAPKAVMQPLSLNLNIDGRTLAQAMSTAILGLYGFPTAAPAADGMDSYSAGDHHQMDH